ncbi:MAG: tripartite tricarboxylate transporter permease [Betaproteobacteria bacterium]|nr:tripartite tricarboxylate transporter permease [Betaproteobacteria bacterium]
MEIIAGLGAGFLEVFQPMNMFVMVIGLVLGMLVAVLPGLTLVMGVVLALPFTYSMGLLPSIILLTAMYVSGTYGGAFTSILFRIPGEPIDVPLLWDGYAMARKGRPAKALGWTLCAALGGGLISATVMVFLSHPVAKFALTLSSPEYFAILIFGMASVVSLGGGSISNAFISLFLGLLIATVGVDSIYGTERFAFGVPFLQDGIEYLLVMVGAYGLGEVFQRLEKGFRGEEKLMGADQEIVTEFPTASEIGQLKGTFFRSSILGIIVGIIPGAGATIASFVAYGAESQYGKRRKEMGSGIAEGIVAPQTAATSSVGGALIPLLTMGIPGSGATAIILGAFLLHGVQPGPQIFVSSGPMVYAIFASLFVSIIGMCILGYFAIKPLVKVLDMPEPVVSAFVVMFCFIGAFAARNNLSDLYVITAFGILGYLFDKFKFPIAPLVLGSILGPLAESSFMTMMVSENNDWTVLIARPVSATVMVLAVIALVYPIHRQLRERRATRANKP